MSDQATTKSTKDASRSSRNAARHVRRERNRAIQPERKLRHMLKRNGSSFAAEWAMKHGAQAVLRRLQQLTVEHRRLAAA